MPVVLVVRGTWDRQSFQVLLTIVLDYQRQNGLATLEVEEGIRSGSHQQCLI